MDPELGSGQLIDEIDLRALEQHQRNQVHDCSRAVALDSDVLRLGRINQAEFVLEARTASAVDGDSQHHRPAFVLGQGLDAARCALAEGDVGFCHGGEVTLWLHLGPYLYAIATA